MDTFVLGGTLNDVFKPVTRAPRTYMPPLHMQFAFRSEYSIGVSIDTFFSIVRWFSARNFDRDLHTDIRAAEQNKP